MQKTAPTPSEFLSLKKIAVTRNTTQTLGFGKEKEHDTGPVPQDTFCDKFVCCRHMFVSHNYYVASYQFIVLDGVDVAVGMRFTCTPVRSGSSTWSQRAFSTRSMWSGRDSPSHRNRGLKGRVGSDLCVRFWCVCVCSMFMCYVSFFLRMFSYYVTVIHYLYILSSANDAIECRISFVVEWI